MSSSVQLDVSLVISMLEVTIDRVDDINKGYRAAFLYLLDEKYKTVTTGRLWWKETRDRTDYECARFAERERWAWWKQPEGDNPAADIFYDGDTYHRFEKYNQSTRKKLREKLSQLHNDFAVETVTLCTDDINIIDWKLSIS